MPGAGFTGSNTDGAMPRRFNLSTTSVGGISLLIILESSESDLVPCFGAPGDFVGGADVAVVTYFFTFFVLPPALTVFAFAGAMRFDTLVVVDIVRTRE